MARDEIKDTAILGEDELDEEDDLDGWGPVRVRRSTLPSPPVEMSAKSEEHHQDGLVAQSEGGDIKTLIT